MCLLLFAIKSYAQVSLHESVKEVNYPICFVDSVRIDYSELTKYKPERIASISVIKGEEANKILSEVGEYGVIFIETKTFAGARYKRYFRSKSSAYSELIEAETQMVYIINEKVLVDNYEGDLASINDSNFKSLEIINPTELSERYHITSKCVGVRIVIDKL